MPRLRRILGLVAIVSTAACDELACYRDPDRPGPPFPPEPPNALPIDTPTETEDGEFRLVLHPDGDAAWPPSAASIALVLEVEAPPGEIELSAAPAYRADDPARRGDDPITRTDGASAFRILASVPDPGLWCLPIDVSAADRIDGLDVCIEAR